MKLKYLFSITLIAFPTTIFCQGAEFKVNPYLNGITSIEEGLIEAGPEFHINEFSLKPYMRLALTDKENNVLQIDRSTSKWTGVLEINYTKDCTKDIGAIRRWTIGAQGEYGSEKFKYYPTGKKAEEDTEKKTSYSVEIKSIWFRHKGVSGDSNWQWSPQIRLRYTKEWESADEIGVVNPTNNNGITTVTDLVIEPPSVTPSFSPAIALNFYTGKGNFSYTPTIYYDSKGEDNSSNPFQNVQRIRFEAWIFYYPVIHDTPNVKIGISPFLSLRTKGSDDFNKIEIGGQVTVKFKTTFLKFF